MIFLATFHWGWLLARRCCSVSRWAGSRWCIAVTAYRRRSARWLAALVAALLAAALARVVPGRPGYWLDLGLLMLALYLIGCGIGSWLRDRVLPARLRRAS